MIDNALRLAADATYRAALFLSEPSHWCKGLGDGYCKCLLQAVYDETGAGERGAGVGSDPYESYILAGQRLAEAIKIYGGFKWTDYHYGIVFYFNDHSKTTHDDVMRVAVATALRLRREVEQMAAKAEG